MHAFYAACTALDAFLSRAAINRRNIEVEREPRERTPRDDIRATRSADFSFNPEEEEEEEQQRGGHEANTHARTHARTHTSEEGKTDPRRTDRDGPPRARFT